MDKLTQQILLKERSYAKSKNRSMKLSKDVLKSISKVSAVDITNDQAKVLLGRKAYSQAIKLGTIMAIKQAKNGEWPNMPMKEKQFHVSYASIGIADNSYVSLYGGMLLKNGHESNVLVTAYLKIGKLDTDYDGING